MRKYLIGCLVGFCLSFAVGAHADDIQTAIGKTIDGEFFVTVNDQKLPVKAITSEGTSYVPLRSFGESQGYTVTFDANLGINLTKTVGDSVYSNSPAVKGFSPEEKAKKIEEIDRRIHSINDLISETQKTINQYNPTDVRIGTLELYNKQRRDSIVELERQKAELTK